MQLKGENAGAERPISYPVWYQYWYSTRTVPPAVQVLVLTVPVLYVYSISI